MAVVRTLLRAATDMTEASFSADDSQVADDATGWDECFDADEEVEPAASAGGPEAMPSSAKAAAPKMKIKLNLAKVLERGKEEGLQQASSQMKDMRELIALQSTQLSQLQQQQMMAHILLICQF